MYNLLISGYEGAWEGGPFVIGRERCVREYTDPEITEKYGELASPHIEELKRFPSLFVYESSCQKDPKFGLIRAVKQTGRDVKVEYQIIDLEKFITDSDVTSLLWDLDIDDWELNRTHWAVKDIDLPKVLATKGVHLPRWTRRKTSVVDVTKHNFDVALSFPGEVRCYVESVAKELERLLGPNTYFYDNNYVAQLARPSLDQILESIYRKQSKLIVAFLCEKYEEKEWCGIEYRVIRDLIKKKKHKQIMYVKIDAGSVTGVLDTDGYIDGQRYEPADVAVFIEERLTVLKKDTRGGGPYL